MLVSISGNPREIEAENILQLLEYLEVSGNTAVVKNGKIIPKNEWASEKIKENDSIDLFSLVSGG